MKCDIDPDEGYPVIATFFREKNNLCNIEYKGGSCKPDCNSNLTQYNAYCLNEGSYSMHVPAPFSWNGDALSCESLYSQSIDIILSVTGLFYCIVNIMLIYVIEKFKKGILQILAIKIVFILPKGHNMYMYGEIIEMK